LTRAVKAAHSAGVKIAISHLTADYAPQAIADSAAAYNARVPVQVHPRTREQLTAICGAVPIQHPGVVPVNFWLRSLHESPGPAVDLHAAVLRLPLPARITTATARPLARPQPSPQEQAADLERTAARHPAYEITTDPTVGRLRYVARARRLSTHPYLVIAATLDELSIELSSAQP
jgi:S-adenosyl methyltransferase